MIVLLSAFIVFTRFRPETEIQRMLRAMSEIQTVREQTAFSWSRGTGRARTATTLYSVGQIDLSHLPDIRQTTRFRLFRLKKTDGYADLSGELRTEEGTTYLTYSPPGPSVPGADFSSKETWVSFPKGDLPKWGAILPGLDAPIVSAEPSTAWTDDGILRMRELFLLADLFLVRYDDVTEIVDAHATRLIEARIDPDATYAFLSDIVRAKEGRDPTNGELVRIEAQAKALGGLSVRLWIGIDDHLLYRFQAAGNIAETGSDAETSVDVLINLTDVDAPYAGELPAPSKIVRFDTLLAARLGTLRSADPSSVRIDDASTFVTDDVSHLPTQTFESASDTDGDGLSVILEAFYQTNPNVADTDGDGVSDGDEVLNGKNPNGGGSLFGFGLGN